MSMQICVRRNAYEMEFHNRNTFRQSGNEDKINRIADTYYMRGICHVNVRGF